MKTKETLEELKKDPNNMICAICGCDEYHPCEGGCEWTAVVETDMGKKLPVCSRCDHPILLRCYEEKSSTKVHPFEITSDKLKKILDEFAPF